MGFSSAFKVLTVKHFVSGLLQDYDFQLFRLQSWITLQVAHQRNMMSHSFFIYKWKEHGFIAQFVTTNILSIVGVARYSVWVSINNYLRQLFLLRHTYSSTPQFTFTLLLSWMYLKSWWTLVMDGSSTGWHLIYSHSPHCFLWVVLLPLNSEIVYFVFIDLQNKQRVISFK
jgi:hypothetical protein